MIRTREWEWRLALEKGKMYYDGTGTMNFGGVMVRALATLGWLRDIGIVLLFLTGNQIRHSAFALGLAIQFCAVVVFAERFLWSWHLFNLRDARAKDEQSKD
jgi:hypothetical protein